MRVCHQRSYTCSKCTRSLVQDCFSRRQFKLGVARSCIECISKIEGGGAAAAAAARDHVASRGRIDGRAHRKAGKVTRDRAARATETDKNLAALAVKAFVWDPRTWQADVQLLLSACGGFTVLQPRAGWDFGYGITDFITTLRDGLVHEPMQCMATENADVLWGVGELTDAAALSATCQLRFTCENPERFHVSSMPRSCIVRHDGGTLLLDGRVPVFGRCPGRLDDKWCFELVRAYRELLLLRTFRRRGSKCASISKDFVVTGLTCDRYGTRLALPFVTTSKKDADQDAEQHAEQRSKDALRAHEASAKLRAVFLQHVWPKVQAHFGCLFQHVREWQTEHDIVMFAEFVNATGMAEGYWARSHVDMDAWYTILVVLDIGAGIEDGHDFSIGGMGYVMQMMHGDVSWFNPLYNHSCTEPHPRANGSRLYISFYCKKDTVNAAALTAAMHARVGNAPLSLCRVR